MKKPKRKTKRPAGGPITRAGKETVSENAMTHGLSGESIILLAHESPADWEDHLAGTIESLTPIGVLESDLCRKIALTTWRMKRLEAYEQSATRYQYECRQASSNVIDPIDPFKKPPDPNDLVRFSGVPDGRALDKVIRYEAHLTRQLDRTLDRLDQLQYRRGCGQSCRVVIFGENKNYKTNSPPLALPAPMPDPPSPQPGAFLTERTPLASETPGEDSGHPRHPEGRGDGKTRIRTKGKMLDK